MGRFIPVVFIALLLTTACTSSTKIVAGTSVYANGLNRPVDNMNLIVDGTGNVSSITVVPKTTDLDSVIITKPILFMTYAGDGEDGEQEEQD